MFEEDFPGKSGKIFYASGSSNILRFSPKNFSKNYFAALK
jgi:hypothetical protein